MSKKYLLTIFAGVAMLAAGCGKNNEPENKPDKDNPTVTDPSGNPSEEPSAEPGQPSDSKITSADFVGTWEAEGETAFVFKEDGSYSDTRWGGSSSGIWSYDETDGILSLTATDSETWTTKVILIGGKAWMVFVDESDTEDGGKIRSFENYLKKGATVESGTLGDGRWDAPHEGVKPKAYDENADYRMCMVVSGTKIDLYVPMWGYHIQGTFTLAEGKLHIETDDDHIWAGKEIHKSSDGSGSIGWNAWGETEDDGPSMNPETFALSDTYTWYTVNELKAVGKQPVAGDPEYENNPWHIEYMIWEVGEQLHEDAMELCDFGFCVTPDGNEAFGIGVGLNSWFYKR